MFKTGSPECIAGIELKLVVEGRATESVVSEQLWDDEKNPVMIFVARRPGCALCREHAVDLCLRQKNGEFGDAKLVAVIKEVSPMTEENPNDDLGVIEFQNQYFSGNPVYLDEKRLFYKALGSRSLLRQKLHTWNPITLYKDFKTLSKRIESKNVSGNYAGEGIIQGGMIVVSKAKDKIFSFDEHTGSEFPYDEIKKVIQSCY